jgi:hypothetical protein
MQGFTVGYQRGSAISPRYEGRRPFTAGALVKVVVEAGPRRGRAPAEDRVGLGSQ